jgi:hypothetical protein
MLRSHESVMALKQNTPVGPLGRGDAALRRSDVSPLQRTQDLAACLTAVQAVSTVSSNGVVCSTAFQSLMAGAAGSASLATINNSTSVFCTQARACVLHACARYDHDCALWAARSSSRACVRLQCQAGLQTAVVNMKAACDGLAIDSDSTITNLANFVQQLLTIPCSKNAAGEFCFPKFWAAIRTLATINSNTVTAAQMDTICDSCLRIVSACLRAVHNAAMASARACTRVRVHAQCIHTRVNVCTRARARRWPLPRMEFASEPSRSAPALDAFHR